MTTTVYDAAVVGASIAGSTVATLLGRAGLRVALIERHRDPNAFKVLCTHHVMACATPTIRRLGLDRRIERAGGIRNGLDVYTPWGWVVTPPGMAYGYSIRRRQLDPMMRTLAADTPGVDVLLGHRVTGLAADGAQSVRGVRVRHADGTEHTVRARLVIGADGAHSAVARYAGARERVARNERFMFFAQFGGVQLRSGTRTQLWVHEPKIAYAMPNDDGVTVLAAMPTKIDLPAFRADPEGALLATLRQLPDAPLVDPADRVSKIVGASDLPLITRAAVPLPGVALVGDAALTSDPSQGVGCGWAFQSAEWLADAVVPALLNGDPLQPALHDYEKRRKVLRGHQSTIEKEAKAGPPAALDRMVYRAAVHDPKTAAHVMAFANRTISLREFLASWTLVRAAHINAMPRGQRNTSTAQSPEAAANT